jgi:protein-S-isoprenylcysteine O-methyltransferase Ste14
MTIKAKSIIAALITYPLLGAMLFGAAGTVHWLAGWTFFVAFTGACLALTGWLLVRDPALVEERMHIGKNQKPWDKVFLGLIYVVFVGWYLVMPIDAVRYGWSHMPVWLQLAGVVLTAASFRVLYVTFRENPFLSGVVRIQEERGHRVISTGPYRFVRHPMYAGALLLFFGVPLWLGSWWGVVVGALFSVVIAARAVFEERTLARELAGYDDYRHRVRFRLVPHVW